MKKNFTILSAILITFLSYTAKAQDEDKPEAKSYLALLGGFSIPQGSFASTNYNNNSAGFAQSKSTIALDAGIYIHKNLALGITFGHQDQGELTQNDVQNLANGYNNSFIKDQTSVTAVNRYSSYLLMGGPQYSFLYKKFTFDLRADAGVIKSVKTPDLTIIFDYSSNSGSTYEHLSSGAVAFAYGGSAGIRYSLGDSWDVGLRANYVKSSGIKIENTGGDSGETGRFQTNLPITMIQTTLGIALKF
jgi:hypothetical protein